MGRKIKKILIANRGEIVIRIAKTAKKMGIATVAIYSEADSDALFVKYCDEAYYIGATPPQESYLAIDKIIAMAKKTQVEAIHPAYGFLSENAKFAQAVEDNDLIFIGPRAETIEQMGSKAMAKTIMRKAKISVTPGYEGKNQSVKFLTKEAEKIGFPLLIKAVAGGGGKGMRVVNKKQDFCLNLELAKSEAKSSFGNDKVILEKYLTKARHIEVQIFGDGKGNIVHLFERDCSIQRRHQKIIEEAPAPNLKPEQKEILFDLALRAGKAVNYLGAGTIETLFDGKEFYFMEMNTRLQVEHPVTEAITDIDIVEWQIRIAQNHKLPLQQESIKCHGHAIEARIYAENTHKEFIPSAGKISYASFPQESCQLNNYVRVEKAVKTNSDISPFYDPMIAKLICAAENRENAIALLKHNLHQIIIFGIETNRNFLGTILTSNSFVQARLDINFLKINKPEILENKLLLEMAIYASLLDFYDNLPLPQEFFAFNNISDRKISFFIELAQKHYYVLCDLTLKTETLIGISYEVAKKSFLKERKEKIIIYEGLFQVEKGQVVFAKQKEKISYVKYDGLVKLDFIVVKYNKKLYIASSSGSKFFAFNFKIDPRVDVGNINQEEIKSSMLAPMAAMVRRIYVKEKTKVSKGQLIMVIEAMKMEYQIKISEDNIIDRILVKVGEQVHDRQQLFSLKDKK